MSKFTIKNRDEAAIDLTPMMDIVFIMLIFFMVTATFVRETGLDINQPEQPELRVITPDDKAILIQAGADGRIFINGDPLLEASVKPRVAKMLAEDPDRMVVIIPDFDAMSGLAIRLYDKVLQVDRNANVAMAAKAE